VTGEIVPGCIFHWKEFQFADGDSADKFIVMLGTKSGCNYLAVVATSKKHHRTFTPGCHADDGYYHIPGGRKDWFPKDTWLLLAAPYELDPTEMMRLAVQEKKITVAGQLREQVANAIRNCLKLCPDVSPAQLALL